MCKFTLPKLSYKPDKNEIGIPLAHFVKPKNLIIIDNILNETHLIEFSINKNKNKTKVGKGAFIGSNSSLIAPIKVGQNSMIGAGSVVTSDVPAERLALGRSRQRNIKKK